MIIIPTEKRFDWAHTPVVLIAIVLINIVVFFGYQSNDATIAELAAKEYIDKGYLDQEWPVFQSYLKSQEEQEQLAAFQLLYERRHFNHVSTQILLRKDFYQHLKDNHSELLISDRGALRNDINKKIDTMSIYALGLTANEIDPLTLITHQFVHGDIMHLLGNMFFLVICGFAVEAAIGRWRFLAFYLLSGVAGGLAFTYFSPDVFVPLVGASGSISGVMAMYVAVFWLKRTEFFYWFFVFAGYIKVPAIIILPFYIAKEIWQFYWYPNANVAFMAHAGGFVAGAILITLNRLIAPNTVNQEYLDEDQCISPKQTALAEIYDLLGQYRFDQAIPKVDDYITTYGGSFDMYLLHYNLLKAMSDDGYQQAAMALLSIETSSKIELKKINAIAGESDGLYQTLPKDKQVHLAIRLTQLPDLRFADKVFYQLYDNDYRDSSLGVLAKKLANAYSALNQPAKASQFNQVADQLFAGSH